MTSRPTGLLGWRRRVILVAGPGLAGAVLAGAVASHGAPLCRVTAQVTPLRAVVGQQLLFDLHIQRRHDVTELTWDRAPSFPAFRSEWLPGLSDEEPIARDGESYTSYHERRALFPARAGRLDIPAVALRCRSADAEEIVEARGLGIPVEAVPSEGRPPGWNGVVGPVALSATVTPTRIAVGESVRISVVARGVANLWDARSPLDPMLDALEPGTDLDRFARAPELARDTGRGLQLRRYWSSDLVPRRVGILRLPDLSIAYFDPQRREYRIARSPLPEIEVVAAAPVAIPAVPPAPTPRTDTTPPPAQPPGTIVALLIASVVIAVGSLLLRRVRGRAPKDPAETIATRLEQAEAAERAGDIAGCATAQARALRLALATQLPDALALTAEECSARAATDAARTAAELLARVEHARFSQAPEAPPTREVRSQITALAPGPDPGRGR